VVWAYVFWPRQQHPAKPPTAGMLVLLLNPKANLSSWIVWGAAGISLLILLSLIHRAFDKAV